MRIANKSIIIDFVVVFSIWLVIFTIGKAFWQYGHAVAENGLYTEIGQDVRLLWNKLFEAESLYDVLEWLPGFIFHLSPIEDAEKPFFITTLGYFDIFYGLIRPSLLPSHALFNLICLILSAFLIVRIFRGVHAPFVGYAVSALFLLNIVLLTDALCGYHTLFGISTALILLLMLSAPRKETAPSAYFLAGLVSSSLFFISPHLIPASLVFLSLFSIKAYASGEKRLRSAAWLVSGLVLPFAYYGLRDIIFLKGYLDGFRRPELARTLNALNKDAPLVFQAFFTEGVLASHQNLPVDFTFIFRMLVSTEGWILVVYCTLGTALGFIATFRYRSLSMLYAVLFKEAPSSYGVSERLALTTRLFVFVFLVFFLNIVILAAIPMPYISRAYLPAIVTLLISATAGCIVFTLSHGRRVMHAALITISFVVGVQAFHYVNFITLFNKAMTYAPRGIILNGNFPENTGLMPSYIFYLKTTDVAQVTLKPLADSYGHHYVLDDKLYCYFAVLKAYYGLTETERYSDGNPLRQISIFRNEHLYYQLQRRMLTGHMTMAQMAVFLASEYDIFSYYTYDIDKVIEAVQRIEQGQYLCL